MEKQSEVVVFGMWNSPYTTRVALALKLKGIPYEYIEEDLANKSELLLQSNPVHKKVPVLVHNGKSIAESLVILEYIDEYWNNTPKLLPEDPYQRAKVRFWANFHDQKLMPGGLHCIMSKGKEQEKAIEDYYGLLKVFEDGTERDFQQKPPFFNGDTLGFLDIVVGSSSCNYKAFAEAFGSSIDPEKHPAFLSWLSALLDCPLMKETLPPHDKVVARLREKFSLSPKVD
ncbi:glutathione S-transferase U10-like [Cornus florida]|uniref:glutathione S-transferase U10-like n=1 Tax=Cornus florida TaxID=4283 RepID=UPI00289D049A|nr:glutathione S-transferase U10-like [Cornus florida]